MTINLATQHIACENCGASAAFVKLTALAMGIENPVCCDEENWNWREPKLIEFEGYFRSQEFISNALGLRKALAKLSE